jgi:Caspase domain
MPGSSGTVSSDTVSGAITESTRAALVVAAYEFEDPKFQRLRSPARDVDALAEVLADPAIGGFTVQSVVNQPNGVVQRELERFFSTRKPDDLLLVYFSCHGVKDSTGRLYFATTNTAFDLLRSTGVPASFVSEQMEYTRSKRIVLLLDCCYSGAFLKGFQARGDESVSVSQLEGRGRAVITASRSTEYAFEADQLTAANAQPSVFTGAVVAGLSTGQADRNGDGVVTVDELYDFVYDHVRGKVAGQTPGRWVNLEGELAVARNPHPPVRAAELPPELLRAVDSDVALHRLGAVWQLGEWLDQGEPGQHMTAREVLERLTQDYDQRVRSAASSILTGPAAAQPIPAAAPPPEPEPEPEAEPALAPTAAAAAPPAEDAVIEPEGRVPPASESAADGEVPDRPLNLTGVTATRTPEPTEAGTTEQRPRLIGRLALAGVIALIVAAFLPFALGHDGSNYRLIDDNWTVLLLLCVAGLAGCAALTLLGQARARGPGIALVLGLAPTAVASGFLLSAGLAFTYDNDAGVIGPGFVIGLIGCLFLAGAAVVAATCAREYLTLAPPPAPRLAIVTAASALMGAGAALGLGELTVTGYRVADHDVPTSLLVNFALWLLLLTTIGCVLSGWLADHRVRGRLRAVATVLLYALVVVAFVFATDPSGGSEALVLAWYASLAVGAMVVPVVSTMLLPRRLGAVLLVAWTVGTFGESATQIWHGDHAAARVVLALSLAAALALAVALWTRPHREEAPWPDHGGASDLSGV